MDALYERLIREVHHYEGTVNELTGDGLVAFFGAPLAVEQAPQRAVRAVGVPLARRALSALRRGAGLWPDQRAAEAVFPDRPG